MEIWRGGDGGGVRSAATGLSSGLLLVDQHLYFNKTMTSNTPAGSVRVIWPRRRVLECCVTWHGLHRHPPNPIERVGGELDRTVEAKQPSAQHLWNSFKTGGEPFPPPKRVFSLFFHIYRPRPHQQTEAARRMFMSVAPPPPDETSILSFQYIGDSTGKPQDDIQTQKTK